MKRIVDAFRGLKDKLLAKRGHREAGMATAEYAIGTVSVVTLGSVLFKILSDPEFREMLWRLIQWLFELIRGIVS